MSIARELEQMEALRMFLIAEFRVAFERRGFHVRGYSDELISSAVRRSAGSSGAPLLDHAFNLLAHGS